MKRKIWHWYYKKNSKYILHNTGTIHPKLRKFRFIKPRAKTIKFKKTVSVLEYKNNQQKLNDNRKKAMENFYMF